MPSEFLRLKSQLPALGIGLGLRGEICDQIIANRSVIDFLEFTPENYRDNYATINWLAQFAESFALVSHSVSLSIGSIDPLDRALLKTNRSFIKQFGLHWWSDHLCFTGVDGKTGNDLFALPWTDETVKHVADKISQAQELVESPLLLENIPFYTRMPKGNFDEAEFIARTLEEADCGMLLDLNNLYVNSLNHNFDPKEFLDRIPLERVVQIHLAGPGTYGARVIDTHGSAVPDTVFELLDYVLSKRTQVKAVMIERDQHFPPFGELLNELNHVRDIWNKYNDSNCGSVPVQDVPSTVSINFAPEEDTELNAPPPAVAELALLPILSADSIDPAVASAKRTHTPAVDESINLIDLAQYERRWFELWTEIKGTDPRIVDAAEYKPDFAHKPTGIDGFDLKALSIYAWLRDSNRSCLMHNTFPACAELMAKEWDKILAEYFYEFQPNYHDNRQIGDRFPEFLRSHCLRYQKDYPYLNELAEFEHLKQAAARSHQLTEFSGEVYLGSTDQIKKFRPIVNPELKIKSFNYPVFEIAAALQEHRPFDSSALDAPLVFAILPQSWKSKVVRLSDLTVRLIEQARSGDRSYSQLIAASMTDQQRNSAEDIARFIQLMQILHDEKVFIGCVALQLSPPTWSTYYESVAGAPPHQTLVQALQKFDDAGQAPGLAIDLGCGAGRDCTMLLKSGWNVFAVDSCEDALNLILANQWTEEQLNTYAGNMEDAPLPPADLINAGVSLPFCAPEKFAILWQNICDALKPGARFSGHFFGKNDAWSGNASMTFQDISEVKELFQGFEIEWFNEFEGPVPIVPSGVRHGQIFEVVARKLGATPGEVQC
ncbi:MAG: DUF692 family protein [Cyanobacteria bacterium SZAS-4]|nr:DUF692 family protein [Cyanobacteria bacterium SZAS-4]